MFINVKIESLKEFSILIPDIDKILDRTDNEIIKTKIDKKYL